MPIGTLTPGFGLNSQWVYPWSYTVPPAFASQAIAASTEKFAILGRFYHKGLVRDGGTKAIRNVGFRFGSVTKAGGSGLTVSLQDIQAANGPPGRPDETQDQTIAIANGDAGFTSNAWYETGNLSADRTVALGDLMGIVFEYDGSGRLGADTVAFSMMSLLGGQLLDNQLYCLLKSGGTWAGLNHQPNIVLKCSDGTYGGLYGAHPASAINSHTFKQDSTPDEYAICVNYPFDCYTDGGWLLTGSTFQSGFKIIFYRGTTVLHSVTIDPQQMWAGGSQVHPIFTPFDSYLQIDKNVDYFLAVQPNQTTANMTAISFDVNVADHLDVCPLGQTGQIATRTDGGDWSKTTTRQLVGGLNLVGPVDRFWLL